MVIFFFSLHSISINTVLHARDEVMRGGYEHAQSDKYLVLAEEKLLLCPTHDPSLCLRMKSRVTLNYSVYM